MHRWRILKDPGDEFPVHAIFHRLVLVVVAVGLFLMRGNLWAAGGLGLPSIVGTLVGLALFGTLLVVESRRRRTGSTPRRASGIQGFTLPIGLGILLALRRMDTDSPVLEGIMAAMIAILLSWAFSPNWMFPSDEGD